MGISRRGFLLGAGTFLFAPAAEGRRARGRGKLEVHVGGPRTLSREQWPPAISPEYVGVVDRGYACLADDRGRLAIVDLKKDDNPEVLGELFGLGRNILGMAITQYRAHALVRLDDTDEPQHLLVSISLVPASDPTIMSRLPLTMFSEPLCIAAGGELIAIGGTGTGGEAQVALFSMPKRKAIEPSYGGTCHLEQTPLALDCQDRQLLVLSGRPNTQLTLLSTANPRAPEKISSIRLEGTFSALSRKGELIAVAGLGANRANQARLFTLKPSLAHIGDIALPAVSDVLDVACQKGQFLILANQEGRQAVVPLAIGKKNAVTRAEAVFLPTGKHGPAPRARIAVKDRDAYVASDWGGVQVLNIDKRGWRFSYSHTIPRLPASAVAVHGASAILAGAELKLYDLSDPRHPKLTSSTDIKGSVRSLCGVGRSVLCLTREGLSLRPVERPQDVLATANISGNTLAYDPSAGRVYVIDGSDHATTVAAFRVSEDSLKAEETFELNQPFRKGAALGGRLLLAGLSHLSLFDPSSGEGAIKPVATRSLPNFAVRDLVLAGSYAALACVDHKGKGFLLVVGLPELNSLGSIDLPHDACAVALSGALAIAVGRAGGGKDALALVSLVDPAIPKIQESFDVLEAASSVAIAEKMAIIAGRGLEIISLA